VRLEQVNKWPNCMADYDYDDKTAILPAVLFVFEIGI
jgi:hypothetical protein